MFINTKEAGKRLNVTERYIRQLCKEGRIAGAERVGRDWVIPSPIKVLKKA